MAPLCALWPSVSALNAIVSRQQATIVVKTPFQPQWSAIQPDARAGDRRPEHVAEEAGEAGGRAGGLLRHEVERVQADDHDRSVDEEADRDERGVVDPERPVQVEPVDARRRA